VERLRALARGEEAVTPDERPTAAPTDAEPPAELDEAALRLAELLRADGDAPRADGELAAAAGLSAAGGADALKALRRDGRAVRVGPNLHFDAEALAGLAARVVAICERNGRVTVAGVRDELGSSRRYAQALLEHLDAERVTRREGDAHVLRRRREGSG
jgi:selenocysteine-specific elongation factor